MSYQHEKEVTPDISVLKLGDRLPASHW